MSKLTQIKHRIYKDYFMPSKLKEYEKILEGIRQLGYEHITFKAYMKKLKNNSLGEQKYFINRHDIDTDIKTAKAFFAIEKQQGVHSTYYFRRSTLDYTFMREIEAYGSEASYHFEEIATYSKKHHLKSKDEVLQNISPIEELFKKNFLEIEERLGIKLQTVCSHGDFANRKLGLINNELTKNMNLRQELGITCETYDADVMESFSRYISDGTFPMDYKVEEILSLFEGKNRVCMLSHPREWYANSFSNTKENLKRVYEGLIW